VRDVCIQNGKVVADVPPELAARYDITVVPVRVRLGAAMHRDGELNLDQLYDPSNPFPVTETPDSEEMRAAYLALAASAAIGLHLHEPEPTPKEDKPENRPPLQATSAGHEPPEHARTRVRPEIHQLRPGLGGRFRPRSPEISPEGSAQRPDLPHGQNPRDFSAV
jgi:hypothetical protein